MKKYSKTYRADKTLYPNLFSTIQAIPESFMFYKDYPSSRHPGAILHRATEEIVTTFLQCFTFYNELVRESDMDSLLKNKKYEEFLRSQENLISQFDSFQDECYLILKMLCPVPKVDKSDGDKFAYSWLKKNNFACVSDLSGRIGYIQKFVDCFSNRIKHSSHRLDFIVAEVDAVLMPGFYVDNLKGRDVEEVYMIIPKKFHKDTVAFSSNMMLRTYLLFFYQICGALEKVILGHLKALHKQKIAKKDLIVHNANFLKLVDEASQLNDYLYPYEYKKFPRVRKSGNEYKISYPHGDKMIYQKSLRIGSVVKGDGYTKKYPIPVM